MLSLIILLFLSVSADSEYEKISKYSSAKVKPDTKVYLDISSFKVGEKITLEFIMDLFFGGSKTQYGFYICQCFTDSYSDSYYWANLKLRYSTDVKCSSSGVCTFKWLEIKEPGAHYIYIKPPTPFSNFYTFWNNKIKVSHTGGLSAGAIAGIVIGCVAGAVILIIIIYYCCCHEQPKPEYNTNPSVPMTYNQPTVTPIVQPVIQPVQPVIQPVQPVIQPVQPVIQPAVPTYYPPPNQPFYPPTAVY